MRYQKIHSQIWNDEKFVLLSASQQRLFLYILTCPHGNIIGLFVLKKGYACDDLKVTSKDLDKDLRKLIEKEIIRYDFVTSLVLIKKFLKHNPLTNPNQIKAAVKMFSELPKSQLLQDFIEVLPEVLKKSFPKQPEAASKPDTDTDTESGTDTDKDLKPPQVVKPQRNIIPPEKEWVEKYCRERNNGIDAQVFIDHYTNTKWRVGKPPGYPMVDWESSIRTWEKRNKNNQTVNQSSVDAELQEYYRKRGMNV